MSANDGLVAHYARPQLEQAILEALIANGTPIEGLSPDDLAPVDEFHLGGREATVRLAKALHLEPSQRLLDLGAGIGGPARTFAANHGVSVTGIDLTPDFVATGNALSARCSLADRVRLREGDILDLPGDASFDRATLIHVGMNIADKAALFAAVRRALKPDGRFGLYDLMQVGPGEVAYPAPWSSTQSTSFVEPPDAYRRTLEASGWRVVHEESLADLVLERISEGRRNAKLHGRPALGLHLVIGDGFKERFANAVAAVEAGTIAPIMMIAEPG
ncbi:SAM-dependent methyltransferase [Acuticoccus sp.]|uniref:SAM-dependent methyltransferase n=1 Tax=Acuticoccus sp. TaxID=1904378 RepID=UPI003B52AC6E